MNTDQIYSIVNDVVSQATGSSALATIDTQGLVSLGNTVLSSSTNTEAFLNTLAQRIGRTIYRYRMYNNKFKDMLVSDMEWGAILQKIRVSMPQAVQDDMYTLTDGQSIDHYVVAKPQANQKLFVTRTPYQFMITIQRETLREAFLSAEAMGSFISLVFGEVRNAIELSLENLGRLTMCAAASEASQATQTINLVTDYNTETGSSLTAATCVFNKDFLEYAILRINHIIDNLQDMSVLYNDGTIPTFTNRENMKIKILSGFQRRLETSVQYAAFHEQFVEIDGAYTTVNFWQGEQHPSFIDIKKPSDGSAFSVHYLVGIIHDRDAFGIYQLDETVLTTPVNAAGAYYNQFWHEKQGRFVDTSENLILITLN